MKLFKKASFVTALFALLLTFTISTSYGQVNHNMEDNDQMTAYTLKGSVVDSQTTNSVADAKVWIAGMADSQHAMKEDSTMQEDNAMNEEGPKFKTTTDANGSFTLENLPKGTHTVKVSADGYKTWEKKLTVGENMDKLTIKLQSEK